MYRDKSTPLKTCGTESGSDVKTMRQEDSLDALKETGHFLLRVLWYPLYYIIDFMLLYA